MYKYLVIIAAVSLFLLGGFVGWKLHPANPVASIIPPQTQSTQVEYRDRIVTVTKTVHPDGTTTEATRTEQVARSTEQEKSTPVVVPDTRSNYSVGVLYHVDGLDVRRYLDNYRDRISIEVGYRVAGDFWLQLGAHPATRDYTIGIRLDI